MASTTNINNSKCVIGVINQNQTVHNYNDNNQLEIKFRLPRLIDNFYGREQEFQQLDHLFFTEMKLKIVVYGLPGYGKTEITKQYAKYCLDNKKVDQVFWLEMEDVDKLKDLSKELNHIYEEFKDVRCMFVFDNSLTRQSIFNCEPVENDKHLLLITSHEADWGPDIVALPLGTLTPPAAVDIIRRILEENYVEEDHGSYEALAAAVYCVPLGVQVAAAYVCEEMNSLKHRFDLAKYIQRIKQSQDFIDKKIPSNISNPYTKSIYGALAISLNKIKDQNNNKSEVALNILYMCAFFSPERIYYNDLLKIGTVQAVIGNNNSSESENELRCAVSLLVNFSFVNYDGSDEDYINIHRLTQSCVRNYLSVHNLLDKYYYECLHAVFNVFDGNIFVYLHGRLVLSYADDNISAVCQFLKTHTNIFLYILHRLVRAGCSECLKTIFENHSKDFEISSENKTWLLMTAAECGQLKVIQVLLDCGVDVNYRNNRKLTPSFLFIEYASQHKPNICKQELNNILELLNYKQHAQLIETSDGRSSLHWAAKAAHEYLVTLLTNAGVAEIVNTQDEEYADTPLHTLIRYLEAGSNKEEIVRIVSKLKACGARADIKNDDQETPLQLLLKLSKLKGYDCEYLVEHLTDTSIEDLDLEDSFPVKKVTHSPLTDCETNSNCCILI